MKYLLEKIKFFLEKHKEKLYISMISIFILCCVFIDKMYIPDKLLFVLKITRYLVLIPILFKIIILDIRKYKMENWIILFILIFIITMNFIFSDGKKLLQYLIIILGAKNIPFKKILKTVLIVEGSVVLSIIILALLKIIPNHTYYRYNGDVVRYSLGFSFATFPAIFIFCLTCYYYYIREKNIKIWEYFVIIVINAGVYIATNTRFDFICSLLITIIAFVYNKGWIKYKLNKLSIVISKYIMILFTVISIILAVIYTPNNKVMKKADTLLSGRLRLMHNSYLEYGFKPFGNDIDWVEILDIKNGKISSQKQNVVDNGYVNIIMNYGWIVLIITLIGYYYLVKQQESEDDAFFKYIVMVTAVHSFINPQIYQIVYNPFLIMFSSLIFAERTRKNKNNKNKEESN